MSSIDAKKLKKAKELSIEIKDDTTELDLDEAIKVAQDKIIFEKEQNRIKKENEKKAIEDSKKSQIVLKDVDGNDVDQADYFYPRLKDETIDGKVLKATTETAPSYFNKVCGMPVDREDILEVFNEIFSKSKKFLFYKARDKELYHIIIPLKYAKTVNKSNESTPGDIQKHAISFIGDGSVNVDSLKFKLNRIANHATISKEPLA